VLRLHVGDIGAGISTINDRLSTGSREPAREMGERLDGDGKSDDVIPAKSNEPPQWPDLPRVLAFYFPQFHADTINDRLWGENFTDWDSLRSAPKLNRLGYPIPRPTELGYYDLSDASSDVARRQGELAKKYKVDGFAYHHYWFYDEEHPGPNLHAPLELMLKNGHPDLPFLLHWCAMKWVSTWQSSGLKNDNLPVDGVLQLQYFPGPEETEFRTRVKEHYDWLRRFFHHKNYIKVNGQPVLMLYQKKPRAAPVLEEFRRLAMKDGFPGLYFTVGLTRPHAHLQSFFPFRGIQRFKGFDVYNKTVAYPNPSDWSNRSLEVPKWCIDQNSELLAVGDPAGETWKRQSSRNTKQRTIEIPGMLVAFDNSPRRKFEDARILSGMESEKVVQTFKRSLKASLYYESCCFPEEWEASPSRESDRFVLINAFNEWAEGMIMEPSNAYGRKFLESVTDAKREVMEEKCLWREEVE